MPQPNASHLTDQQRHARAGRAQTPPPRAGAGDKARHSQTSNGHKALAGTSATDSTRNDVFDSKGKFLKSEPGNRALGYSTIYVQTSAKRLKLTEAFAASGPGRVQMLRDITVHYAREMKIIGLVGVGRTSEANAIAFFNPKSKVIAIKFLGNKIDSALNNIYTFKTSLEHEYQHAINDSRGHIDKRGISHADVYLTQFKKHDFKSVPLIFRERLAVGMIKELFRDPTVTIEDAQLYIEKNANTLRNAGLSIKLFDIYGNRSITEYQLNNRPRTQVPFED